MKKIMFLGLLLSICVDSANCMDRRPTAEGESPLKRPCPSIEAFLPVDTNRTFLHEFAEGCFGELNIDTYDMMCDMLRQHLDEINSQDIYLLTPLHLASKHGKHEFMRFLIENGANVDLREKQGKTALHFAAAQGDNYACEILLNAGAYPFFTAEGQMPIEVARLRKKYKTAAFLMNYLKQKNS